MIDKKILRRQLGSFVPPEVLREIIKQQKEYKPEALTKDEETLLNELFRVCPESLLLDLREDYCLLTNTSIRCEAVTTKLNPGKTLRAVDENVDALPPDAIESETPLLYDYTVEREFAILKYAARDGHITIQVSLDRAEEQRFINRYDVILHFSKVPFLFFAGAETREKARRLYDKFIEDTSTFLEIQSEPLVQPRGKGRPFYWALKSGLSAKLIKTKRDDLRGNYKTITLEARHLKPDLDDVPDFVKHYKDADSYYDVLQFSHKNKVGIVETTHVRFGLPHGLFAFRPGTSLTTVHYCFEKIADALSGI